MSMASRLSRLAAGIGRNARGAVTVELAIAAPVLSLIIIGVSDISIAYGRKLLLEQGAQRAIEKVMQTTGEDTPEDTIKKEAVCQINGTNADNSCKSGRVSVDDVTVTYRKECDGAETAYELDCADGQTEVRYIMARVEDEYEPIFDVHFGTGADGDYDISATAGVRVG